VKSSICRGKLEAREIEMNLDDALQTFIAESRELLQDMEAALLNCEQTPDDPEVINALFRAAHTIKGSAGLFGLDHIVAFTHVTESVLDKVRSAELKLNAELVAILLTSRDHISDLLEHLASGGGEPPADVHGRGQKIVQKLRTFLEAGSPAVPAVVMNQVEVLPDTAVEMAGEGAEAQTDNWHISLRFGPDVLRNGMDPLAFLRYLERLGSIERIVTLLDAIPPAQEMDPETCYIGFEIGFNSAADKAAIEGTFDFIRDDSEIRILPPHSRMSEYLRLIKDLPGEDMRVGEMLVNCGTLTPNELETALAIQKQDGGEAVRPLGEVLVQEGMVNPVVMDAALEKQKQIRETRSADSRFIRVDSEKLDHLINLVGELIIAGASNSMIARRMGVGELIEASAGDDIEIMRAKLVSVAEMLGELNEADSTMSRLVEEVRDTSLDLRMVQIGATFSRFQRVVRDVSHDLGKEIELVISGAETELDKTVVEKIGDPLTHLVRNSMDHGIEPVEVRRARGKPDKGTLRLNAFHDSGSIVIEVGDDGGGLDRDAILAKAFEKGLIGEGQNLSDREIYNLIFEAGFSTAKQVSNLSGRGVGMDVVRSNIQALRGTVDLESKLGEGTTVRIRLPLTLAIIDGFLVGVAGSFYVVPLDMVVECVELEAWNQNPSGNKRYLNLRGEVLPYLRLHEHFEAEGEPAVRENVVVVRFGEKKVGLVVDILLGEFQTVIKPLGRMFSKIKGIGGFTILGGGDVALVLDVAGLMQQIEFEPEHGAMAELSSR